MAKEVEKKSKGLGISAKSFLTAIIVIFALMVVTYILTFIVNGGAYKRIPDDNGKMVVDPESFKEMQGGVPFWKWLLSPLLVFSERKYLPEYAYTYTINIVLIVLVAFLLIIGGVFNCLDRCGLIHYMLLRITKKFGKRRYLLLIVVTFFFMGMGSLVGSFEEVVPLVPIAVALAVGLGWDKLTGIGMSLLAVGCGFAAGVFNPFTVGTAQTIAGLPMFSRFWFRMIAFVCIYGLLVGFLLLHAKRVAKPMDQVQVKDTFVLSKRMDVALIVFVAILGVGIALVLCSAIPFLSFLQNLTTIIVAITFLIAGIVSVLVAGFGGKNLIKYFFKGLVTMLPAILMILMASSIKYTLEEAQILDTALHAVIGAVENWPKWTIVLVIYLIVLAMNFFIPSGSAKAFMLIPLIIPLAQACGISMQLCIVAFAFGDGFSNVFYPTNPALLISLGLADTSYGRWVRYSGLFQLGNLVLTILLLMFGLAIGV